MTHFSKHIPVVKQCLTVHGLSYLLTAQEFCYLYAGSKTLSLKWKPRGNELRFPLRRARMNT